MTARITADALIEKFVGSRSEFALIDPMEEGVFALTPHLIQATNIPLSVLELRINDLVPVKSTPIVISHDIDGLGDKAASVLTEMGYSDVAILQDPDGKLPLYIGFNVKSKAFGEVVEHAMQTPTLEPDEARKILERDDCILVDVRPFEEYNHETIPGAVNLTGAEFYDLGGKLNADGSRRVIVNCGGRTRSILGAQSLIDMGVRNVASLKNGTMGWHLEGFGLDYGANRGPEMLAIGHDGKAGQGGNTITPAKSASWADWQAARDQGATCYLFDLRPEHEISAAPVAAAKPVSGIQLIQATDCYCVVQNAQVFLLDPTGVRADVVATWLSRMGISNVSKIAEDVSAEMSSSDDPGQLSGLPEDVPLISAESILQACEAYFILDLTNSHTRSSGHIPGSVFAIRARLDPVELRRRVGDATLVVTGDDAGLVALTCRDLSAHFRGKLLVLDGGSAAWQQAGGALDVGFGAMICEPEDVFVRPMERSAERDLAMKSYLDWEVELHDTIGSDPTLKFDL